MKKNYESYDFWLKANGVQKVLENAGMQYIFADRQAAIKFKTHHLDDDNKFCKVFLDKHLKKWVVLVNAIAQKHLKNQYLKIKSQLSIAELRYEISVKQADKKAVIYSVADYEMNGYRVAIDFASQQMRKYFIDHILKIEPNLAQIFHIYNHYNLETLHIKTSPRIGEVGTFRSANNELSIAFNSDNVARAFIKMLGINDQHAYLISGGKLYFKPEVLPLRPDKNKNIITNISLDILSSHADKTKLSVVPMPVISVGEQKKVFISNQIDKKARSLIKIAYNQARNKDNFCTLLITQLKTTLFKEHQTLSLHDKKTVKEVLQYTYDALADRNRRIIACSKFIDFIKELFSITIYKNFIDDTAEVLELRNKAYMGKFTKKSKC